MRYNWHFNPSPKFKISPNPQKWTNIAKLAMTTKKNTLRVDTSDGSSLEKNDKESLLVDISHSIYSSLKMSGNHFFAI